MTILRLPKEQPSLLYWVVFESVTSRTAALLLLVILLIQPLSFAYAAAEDAAEEESETELITVVDEPSVDAVNASIEEVLAEESESEEEESAEDEEIDQEEVADVATDESASQVSEGEEMASSTDEVVEEEVTATSTEEVADEEQVATSTEQAGTQATSTPDTTATTTATSTDSTIDTGDETATTTVNQAATSTDNSADANNLPSSTASSSDSSSATSTDMVVENEPDEEESETATSTEEAQEDLLIVDTASTTPQQETFLRNEQNYYQFGRSDCITVGDGSFYCGSAVEEDVSNPEERFFAAPDADGDQEIFANVRGEVVQLTHNMVNDAAPHYDAVSNSIVWHRLIQDRYQIMRRSFETNVDEVLTHNGVNDMEPTHFGENVVWQRWVDNNWEIIHYDGESYTQLTDNDVHDLAPSIRNNFILWKTIRGDTQDVTIYDLNTGEFSSIKDAEAGASVQNPRFMFVYETLSDSGDIVTKGFDPVRGEIIPIGVLPAELPDEIPVSDQTGETRALIQNKSTTGRELEEAPEEEGVLNLASSSRAHATASSMYANQPTLIIPAHKSTSTSSATIIRSATTSEKVEHISDVVLPKVASGEEQ